MFIWTPVAGEIRTFNKSNYHRFVSMSYCRGWMCLHTGKLLPLHRNILCAKVQFGLLHNPSSKKDLSDIMYASGNTYLHLAEILLTDWIKNCNYSYNHSPITKWLDNAITYQISTGWIFGWSFYFCWFFLHFTQNVKSSY